MKFGMLLVLGAWAAAGSATAPAGTVDSGLQDVLAATPPDQPVSVLIYLAEQVDIGWLDAQLGAERASLRRRHEVVVRALQTLAEATQGDLLARLNTLSADGKVSGVQPFWITNCIRLDTTAAVIEEIARRPDVGDVYFNFEIESIRPVGQLPGDAEESGGAVSGDVANGIVAVRAPEVWALGITGEGVLVSSLDTGVDGNHPALGDRWQGVADPRYADNPEWAWFDPVTNTTFPQAWGGHGTHTMGSICGGPPGEHVGVAPDAQWIHAAVIDRVSIAQTVADAILSFQWIIDPDGDPGTTWDVPAVCSNSWGLVTAHGYPPCDETFWTFLDACEASGIVMVFAAGNEGSSGLRRPGDRATDDYRTCAVAALDANDPSWPIAGFSSRGPTFCTPDGSAAIKPDIAAPGVNVRSSVPGGGYQSSGWSGTSMATPHVAGVVALMRQACPDLAVEDIKQIIFDTAYDLGSAGEDNSYGWGMVDAYEAVLLALGMCAGTGDCDRDDDIELTDFAVFLDCMSGPGVPVPFGGCYCSDLDEDGDADLRDFAAFQNVFDCVPPTLLEVPVGGLWCPGDLVVLALQAEGNYPLVYTWYLDGTLLVGADSNTYTIDSFGKADAGSYVVTVTNNCDEQSTAPIELTICTVLFHDDFDTDQGWTMTYSSDMRAGRFARGVPNETQTDTAIVQPGQDNPNGSGTSCYVTDWLGGEPEYHDVDGGPTTITSPIIDLSGAAGVRLQYAYWFFRDNALGDDVMVVSLSNDDGNSWTEVHTHDVSASEWRLFDVEVESLLPLTSQMRLRVAIEDAGSDTLLEGLIDDVRFVSGD